MRSGLPRYTPTPITEGYRLPRRWRWTRSLRFRLTAWYTGFLALVLLSGFLLFYFGARQVLLTQTDLFLSVEAQRIAQSAAGRAGPDLNEVSQAVVSPAMGSSAPQLGRLLFEVIYIRVLTQGDQRGLAISPDLANQPALLPSLDGLLNEPQGGSGSFAFCGPDQQRTMRVFTTPLPGGRDGLWLQVAVPYHAYEDILDRLAMVVAAGLLAVLVVAAVGGWLLIKRTLQPIQRIATEAQNLTADNVFGTMLPTAETDNEIGHLVHTLNQLLGRLDRAFEAEERFAEAQQRFAADASHELRTPLTILRGEMELALTRPRSVESYQTTIASAVEEIDRMTHIVQALSFLARQDALQITAEPVRDPVDLRGLVKTVATEFERAAAEKSIALTATEGTETAWVLGDEGQLHQLLRNLVENAIKYTPAEGKVTVSLTQRSSPAGWLVQVEDTGIGIAENQLPHVFERFWRADRARTTPGSGLGLAISARIAQVHQGTLRVQSTLGQGSRFELLLPAAAEPALTTQTA